eukprot:CAMPEP_0169076148 /NCGR_PEP_ID=MMETSP1015-20121227/8195_1 /TAXON_ID=342587 /ORGANISM="Karlodinium micrum, Strain CCMP2283" /LENGTH=95 /DNA_ID=CAMNT_0009135595 /DNA_START=96 /DNA_END=383 /DNA_ORIENTATION=+
MRKNLWSQLCDRRSLVQNYRCKQSISQLRPRVRRANDSCLSQTDEDSEDEDTARSVNIFLEDEGLEDEPDEYDAQKCIMQPFDITCSPSPTKLAL